LSKVVEARTLTEISNLIINNNNVIIDWAAESWCVPCKRFKPHFDAASDKVEGYVFVHVDIDEVDPIVTKVFGIQSVPTVMLFTDRLVSQRTPVQARTAPALIRELSLLTDPSIVV